MAKKRHHRILLKSGELKLGAERWQAAVAAKLIVVLSPQNHVAELAPGVTTFKADGAICLRRNSEPGAWIWTNWQWIFKKNSLPNQSGAIQ